MSHPELLLKVTQEHNFGWLQHYMHSAEVNFLDFLDINGVKQQNCLDLAPSAATKKHRNSEKAAQHQRSFFILLVFCCFISSFSFTKRAKRVIDVFIVLLASCQWSILLSCCEMKLLHAQLSPSSQAHHDKTLTKTCQLWVCGKAFRSESECMFKVKTPNIRNSPTASLELIGWWMGNGSSYWWKPQLKCCCAHMPLFLELEQLAFFSMWFIEGSPGLDLRWKELSVNICNTAAHLLLISHNDIPDWISGILGYSILLNTTAEWLIPDQLDHSPNNEVFVFLLILLPKIWNGMVIELLIKCPDARAPNSTYSILPCLERSCSGFSQRTNYNTFTQKGIFELL